MRLLMAAAADRDPERAPRADGSTATAIDRREFLRRAGLTGAAVAAASAGLTTDAQAAAARKKPVADAPRIVVVGAGLAGLTAAYRLQQAGYAARVHEAANRVGGRCWTRRGAFAEGQIAERGGEFIDTAHKAMLALVREFRLDVDDLPKDEAAGTEDLYYFDGAPYTFAQASDDVRAIKQTLTRDVNAAGYPTLYTSSTARGQELDRTSVSEYIDQIVPGGLGSKLGQLLEVAYTTEYGGESSDQSSLNLLYLLGYSTGSSLQLFGPSDERYRVRGGNDQVPARLADALSGQITTGSALVAIRRTSSGPYQLTFQEGAATRTVSADRVVLTLPFRILRDLDFSGAGFKQLKQTAIRELGMGTNAKLTLQFGDRHWRTLGNNGATFSDTGYQSTWEVTRAQPGRAGVLVDYTGGTVGAQMGSAGTQSRAQRFLQQIEPVLPGLSGRYNGRATLDDWPRYPFTLGSYSYWRVGQYTRFAGVEREVEGACHFAGEHTSVDFQGYLNGAVETGERAASEVLDAVR